MKGQAQSGSFCPLFLYLRNPTGREIENECDSYTHLPEESDLRALCFLHIQDHNPSVELDSPAL